MAQLGQYDQGAQAQARQDFGVIPEGDDYVGIIIDTDVKPNSNNNGMILKNEWELIHPLEFKGRKLWQRINIQHTGSAEAHRIGQIELANLKAAAGLPPGPLADSVHFHNKPIGLKVKIEKGKVGTKYDKDQNVIFDTFAVSQGGAVAAVAAQPAPVAVVAPAPVAAPAAAAAAPAANAAPWLKKA